MPDSQGKYHVTWDVGTSRFTAAQLRPVGRDGFRQLCHADISGVLGFAGAGAARLLARRPR